MLREDILARPLALAHALLDGVRAFVQQLSELGAIDLPPVVRSSADVGHVQIAASLYLAAELEAARLVPAVETLAGLFASGALRLEDEAARQLYVFWQGRHERFSQQERRAIFARLFGHPAPVELAASEGSNRGFEEHLAALAQAIVALRPEPLSGRRPIGDATLSLVASRLVHGLVSRSGGIAAFAARDMLKTIEAALAILKLRPVQAALGVSNVWAAVRAVGRYYLEEEVDVNAHVLRGRSGMLLLTWVAEILPQLEVAAPVGRLLASEHPVHSAAMAWLQATEDLYQAAPAWQPAQDLPFPRSGALAPAFG
jgi:hypothetical protein